MAILFGKEYSRMQLLERVGDITQLCHANRCRLAGGKREGVESVFFNNSSGLNFSVIPGRGMDFGPFIYKGMSLSWRSAAGEAAPAFFEPQGAGMDRNYHGGLMHISGISYAGLPCEDEGESLGLHGRISNTPADEVYTEGCWIGDDYELRLKGRVREATATGKRLELTRTVSVRLGEPAVYLDDVVENIGMEPAEHMLLYHTNFGFPLLDDGTEFIIPSTRVVPFNDFSAAKTGDCFTFPGPDSETPGELFYHELSGDNDGNTGYAVINRDINNGKGLCFSIEFNRNVLNRFVEWKYSRRGYYAAELGPSNCHVAGRAKERADGTLKFLGPGEKVNYRLKIRVSEGTGIAAVEDKIRRLT